MRRWRLYGELALVVALSASVSACRKRSYNAAGVKSERPSAPNQCGEPGQPGRPNPAHCEGPFHIDGAYTIDETAFAGTDWAGASYSQESFIPGLFGTTTLYDNMGAAVLNPRTGKPKIVRDLHYHLGGGRVGLRPIPVMPNSSPEGKLASGESIRGSEVLDRVLRKHFGFNENDDSAPLFALAAYLYPGQQLVYMTELAESKSQGSIGHMSAYIGRGESRHSPFRLHENEWSVAHHEPSTLIAVRMKDANQAMVNRNMVVMSRLLNELNGGPQFPGDYTFDPVRVYNLQAMFEFFRKWIVGGAEAEKLKNDPTWGIYCAEFVTLATNLGLNLPLTKAYFEKIWPNGVGTQLWARLQERYREVFGESMPTNLITDGSFKPLWEHDGITNPLKTAEPSKSMAWPLDTTADLVSALIENFGAWPDVTPAMSTAMMLNFADTAGERIGVPPEQFVNLVMPIALPSFKHHVSTMPQVTSRQAYDAYIQSALIFFEGTPAAVADAITAQLRSDAYAQAALALPKVSTEQAWKNYLDEIGPALRNARGFTPPLSIGQQRAYRERQMQTVRRMREEALRMGDRQLVQHFDELIRGAASLKTFVRFNSPPSLAFRVANGLRPSHPALDVQAVGTIFQAPLLRTMGTGKSQYIPDTLPPTQRAAPEAWNKDWDPEVFEGEGDCEGGPCG